MFSEKEKNRLRKFFWSSMPNHSSLKGTLMKREILHDMFKISRELQDKVFAVRSGSPC